MAQCEIFFYSPLLDSGPQHPKVFNKFCMIAYDLSHMQWAPESPVWLSLMCSLRPISGPDVHTLLYSM